MKHLKILLTLLLLASIVPVSHTQQSIDEIGYYVQAGDARLYYEIYGKGEPIVLLHGGIMGSIAEMHDFYYF